MYAPHQPLTGGQVFYIGRAAPTMTLHGIDAIQKPLSELYSKSDRQSLVDEQESIATVLTSGIHIKPINTLDKDTWHRIQDLDSCAAVKAYNDPTQCGRLVFVPNDSMEARSSPHLTVFAVVMKRSSGIAISDCYAYICPSDSAAATLVQACKHAYNNTSGWANDRPTDAQLGIEKPKVVDKEFYVDDQRDDCAPEFYEKPLLSGFFYTPRSDLIQKFNIGNEGDFTPCQRAAEQCSIEHFTCPGPVLPQPPVQLNPQPLPPIAQVETSSSHQLVYQPQQMVECSQQLMYPSYEQQMLNYQQQQQMYMIAAQDPDSYIQGVHAHGHLTKDQIKAQKKAEKKFRKEHKNYCPSESSDGDYRQPLREFTGNGVACRPGQMNNGAIQQEQVYVQSLPQSSEIVPVRMTQQDRLVGNIPSDFALGMGDLGPPPSGRSGGNYYGQLVGKQQPVKVEDEMALYSRRLPQGEDCTFLPPGARDFDGNFIMKQHDDYKYGGGGQVRGRSYGVMTGSDQY